MRNELPETCLATLPGTGDLIVIKRGETGYYRSDWETGDKAKNQEIADLHNRKRGITPAQVQAMQIGSMFGFDVPGASPQIYFDEARYLWPLAAGDGMVMKDPMTDRCCSIDGSIYQYQVAGEKCFYMEVSSVPESMMGVGREQFQNGASLADAVFCRNYLVESLSARNGYVVLTVRENDQINATDWADREAVEMGFF